MTSRWFLFGCAAISALCIAINAAWPPETYAYIPEMALVLAFALAALLLSRETVNGAVFLFCAGALIPVLAMIEHYHATIGGQMIWIAAPLVGLVIVCALTQHTRATCAYTVIALVADLLIGTIYQDAGQAGALCILTASVGGALVHRCQKQQAALDKLGIIERGLAGYVGGSNT